MFRASLEDMYPDTEAYTCYTKKGLQELVDRSNQRRLRDKNDVINYYRTFHEISNHLTAAQLSAEERNEEFFMGFHPDDREILSNRLYALKPNHPPRQAHDLQDVKAPSCLKVRLARLVLRRVLIEKSLGDTKDSLEGNDLEGHKGE